MMAESRIRILQQRRLGFFLARIRLKYVDSKIRLPFHTV